MQDIAHICKTEISKPQFVKEVMPFHPAGWLQILIRWTSKLQMRQLLKMVAMLGSICHAIVNNGGAAAPVDS